jgi:hypothetical protein
LGESTVEADRRNMRQATRHNDKQAGSKVGGQIDVLTGKERGVVIIIMT